MSKRSFIGRVAAVAFAAALCIGATAGSALAGDTAVGRDSDLPLRTPPPPSTPEPLPPNCEIKTAHVEGSAISVAWIECNLPPECEVVTHDLGNGLGISYIDCDIDDACSLESGEWNGYTYWYIDCDEPQCIGGCNPIVPIDPVLNTRPQTPPDPGFVPVPWSAATGMAAR